MSIETICGFPVNEDGVTTGIPCPFCHRDTAICCGVIGASAEVECTGDDCYAIGPEGATTEEAIEKWLRVPSWRRVKEGEPLPEWVQQAVVHYPGWRPPQTRVVTRPPGAVVLHAHGVWHRPELKVSGDAWWMPLPPLPDP